MRRVCWDVQPLDPVVEEVLADDTVIVFFCQELVEVGELVSGPNKVEAIITLDGLWAVSPGHESVETGSEGSSGEV